VRSRVATLVAGGNRALNTLEPGAASGAFAAALALSPDDAAAREGSQRARRLEGVAALLRDAREATARGDHARAVQGYAQALANDPRNRGLTEALATARRSLGRDATGALLADGHAALGKGHFEEAQAAFEQALAADPQAPGARQAAEQASRAILLRDQAEARRVAATDPRQN
jgi:tetratricopeptide (TPR) repeat protein